MNDEIKWQERFFNFKAALDKLVIAVEVLKDSIDYEEEDEEEEEGAEAIDEMLKEGLIHRFEYTCELAWNVMKDYAEFKGSTDIKDARSAIAEAVKLELTVSADVWIDIIENRKLITQTYNPETADEIYDKIVNSYYPALLAFEQKMDSFIPTS